MVRVIVLPNGTYVLANGTQCRKGEKDTICHAPVIDGPVPVYQCSATPPVGPEGGDLYKSATFLDDFLHWTDNTANLVFGYGDSIWTLDLNSLQIMVLIDANPQISGVASSEFKYGFYADVSPNGRQIAYSSCEYETEYSDDWLYRHPEHMHPDNFDTPDHIRGKRDYEIAVVSIDGGKARRLTDLRGIDHFPAWSPDGTRIAFLSNEGQGEPLDRLSRSAYRQLLYTMAPDGSELRKVVSRPVGLSPPVWSPDSGRLAFVALEGSKRPYRYVLHTVNADGSEMHAIGEVNSFEADHEYFPLPSWSPDGKRIAFATGAEDHRSIYTALPDGTDQQLVVDGFAVRQIAWSPDGSEIFFVTDWLYLVNPDGSSLRRLDVPGEVGRRMADAGSTALAEWSPDGSRIAIHYPGKLLVTMNRDGTHNRILYEGDLQPRPASPPREPVDPAVCAAGGVVPDPEANPGLVQDCEALLTAIEVLAGDSTFSWSPDVPITRWEGVVVGGSPPRVRELNIPLARLSGTVPPELGSLQALEFLDLSQNPLVGEIPPELGSLVELVSLRLKYTYLSGPIPPELGELTNLTMLVLSGNGLSGSIPPKLSSLTNLRTLNLADNRLTGCIPSEFSDIWVTGSDLDRCESGG